MERLTMRSGDMVWYKGEHDGKPMYFEPCDIKAAYEGTSYIREMLVRLSAYEEMETVDPDEYTRRRRILQDAVQTWGRDAQALMMIEEMSELTKAICKLYRATDDGSASAAVTNIKEEMADVQIMLDQMKIMFGDVSDQVRAKLNRLENRLDASHAAEAGKP